MKVKWLSVATSCILLIFASACSEPQRQGQKGERESPRLIVKGSTQITLLKELQGHSGAVTSIVFSPDGSSIASGSRDRNVIIWDLQTGHVRHTLSGHHLAISALAYSPDSTLLASSSYEDLSPDVLLGRVRPSDGGPQGNVVLWDTATGRLRRRVGKGEYAHSYPATALAFGPRGNTLAVASWYDMVTLFDVATGGAAGPLLSFKSQLLSVAFSADGSRLIVGLPNRVDISEPSVGVGYEQRALRPINPETSPTRAHFEDVAVSRDGDRVVTVTASQVVLWDTESATAIRSLDDGLAPGYYWRASIAPNRSMIAISTDSNVLLWDVMQNAVTPTIRTPNQQRAPVAWSPDGRVLATLGESDATINLWRVQ